MSGHRHINDPNLTQNQGNMLGDRPCVRQSKLYREQCGGNTMKEILGQNELKWSTTQTEGCYKGGSVYDHDTLDHRAVRNGRGQQQQQQQQQVQQPQQRQQPQQQYQQQQQYQEEEEGEYYDEDAYEGNQGEEDLQIEEMPPQQQYQQQQQQQQAPAGGRRAANNNGNGALPPPQSVSTQRGFRPGAGQANRQTYNIFTGK